MALNTFFDKFILTSQLKFQDHNFRVMNIPFVIFPVDVLLDILSPDNSDVNKSIYYGCKQSTLSRLSPKLSQEATKTEFIELAESFFTASGWGLIKQIEVDTVNHRAIVVVTHSPVSVALKGVVKNPIDHYLRGVLAGIFSSYFDTIIDCVESECTALKEGDCTFVIKPLEEFDFTNELTQRQLSIMKKNP